MFGLFVADVNRVVVGTVTGSELAAVDAERFEDDRAISGKRVGAVLPLHYGRGALGGCC